MKFLVWSVERKLQRVKCRVCWVVDLSCLSPREVVPITVCRGKVVAHSNMGQHIAFCLILMYLQYCMPKRIGTRLFRVGEQFSQAACHDAKNQSNPCKTHCKIHLLTLNVSSFLWGCSLHALHVPAVRHGLSFFEFIIVRVCGLVHVYPNGHTHTYTYIYICIYIYMHIRAYTYTYLHIDVMATDTGDFLVAVCHPVG